MISIAIKKRLKAQDNHLAIDVNLEIHDRQLVTLYGSSGAGKTTILRLISGLLNPDSGHIRVGEETWFDSENGIDLPVQKRNVGLVFQDYALFPNMTVAENILYAAAKHQNKNDLDEWLGIMQLSPFAASKPNTLSGGQKQRVALARALIRRPKLLLLDEPLSALDIEMRSTLQEYILKVHKEFNLTTVLVSHDISEIVRMSEKVFFLENGMIKSHGTPKEVFEDITFNLGNSK